eukprot:1760749-Prymnesium_polylepis.1
MSKHHEGIVLHHVEGAERDVHRVELERALSQRPHQEGDVASLEIPSDARQICLHRRHLGLVLCIASLMSQPASRGANLWSLDSAALFRRQVPHNVNALQDDMLPESEAVVASVMSMENIPVSIRDAPTQAELPHEQTLAQLREERHEMRRTLSNELSLSSSNSLSLDIPSDVELTPLLMPFSSGAKTSLPLLAELPFAPALLPSRSVDAFAATRVGGSTAACSALPFEMGATKVASQKRKRADAPTWAQPRLGASDETLRDLANSEACSRFRAMLRQALSGADAHTMMLLGPTVRGSADLVVQVLMQLSPRQLSLLHPPVRALVSTILDCACRQLWRDEGSSASRED